MSWMDSWSRPSKSSAIPPPYYLTHGDNVPYCHTCGRVMTPRKSHNKPGNPVKYCSDRCRRLKPGPQDRKIERAIASLLEGGEGVEKTEAKQKIRKGDHRIIITCDELELVVFGREKDPLKSFGRNKNRYHRAIGGPDAEFKSVDMVSGDEKEAESTADESHDDSDDRPEFSAGSSAESEDENQGGAPLPGMVKQSKARVRPPQEEAEMNFSAMGGERSKAEKISESSIDLEKRMEGQKRAEEREIVRRAARRAVVFGLLVDKDWRENVYEPPPSKKGSKKGGAAKDEVVLAKEKEGDYKEEPLRRKCEALMQGQLVEPSFAKGNWAIRWRE